MAISPSATKELLVEERAGILILTLNRPERMNAISREMLSELSAKLVEADRDADIRCIILTGAGRGFCAGLDLVDTAERVAREEATAEESARAGSRPRQLFDLRDAPITVMWRLDKPVIAAINGPAAGYGMDLTLIADMRIAGENAKLAAVAAKRNVVPESGGTWLLPRLIGWGRAAEIYYRARVLDAAESHALGLVNKVVPQQELMSTALLWAEEIAANAPRSVQTTKRMMRMGLEESFDTAVDHLMVHLGEMLDSEDFREGVRAFIEKREPKFTGR